MSQLDHLVLGARTLEEGIAYVEGLMGVVTPPGGEHPDFGTHNCVMQLGPQCYFEIIAINPQAPAPVGTRWYGLDDEYQASQLEQGPALIAWVVAVDDLETTGQHADWIEGSIKTITRGTMHWQMLLPDKGLLNTPFCPWLIHWPPGQQPHHRLADLGCNLDSLTVEVPDVVRYEQQLVAAGAVGMIEVRPGNTAQSLLSATVQSPRGEVRLTSYPVG